MMFFCNTKIKLSLLLFIVITLFNAIFIPCLSEESSGKTYNHQIIIKPIIECNSRPEELIFEIINKDTGERLSVDVAESDNYFDEVYVESSGEYKFYITNNDPLSKTRYSINDYALLIDDKYTYTASPVIKEYTVHVEIETETEATIEYEIQTDKETEQSKKEIYEEQRIETMDEFKTYGKIAIIITAMAFIVFFVIICFIIVKRRRGY